MMVMLDVVASAGATGARLMSFSSLMALLGTAIIPLLALLLLKFNSWYFEPQLKAGQAPLPPGDLGLPVFGNMLQFLTAFKWGDPQSFIGNYIRRYTRVGVYKAYMFGQPTVLATTPEACKFVLMGDDLFKSGWPKSTVALMGKKAFTSLEKEEHRRLRKLTAATVNGPAALSKFMPRLQSFATQAMAQWAHTCASTRQPVPLLIELRKLTFNMIAEVFMGYSPGRKCDEVERYYRHLNDGIRAMPIDFPGTAYHTALKSRRKLVELLQEAIDDRRRQAGDGEMHKDDLMQALMVVRDEADGSQLTDEEIIDVLLMYLNAGHESSAHTVTWILILLRRHPAYLHKVKMEQLAIRQRKQPGEILTFEDYRRMTYLSQVVDETLRLINISPMVFRKSLEDVEFNGYTIPKGWHVQTWMRQVHLDPQVYSDPLRFDPDRWDRETPKAGAFIPFGAGAHMCPGNDFAKLEIALIIHYAVLDYEFEPVSPDVPVIYLPHPRPKDWFMCRVRRATQSAE